MNTPVDDAESLTSATKKMAISNEDPTSLSVAKSDEMRDEKSVATEVSLPSTTAQEEEGQKVTSNSNEDEDIEAVRDCVSEEASTETPHLHDCVSEEASAETPNPPATTLEAKKEDDNTTSKQNEDKDTESERDNSGSEKIFAENSKPSVTASQKENESVIPNENQDAALKKDITKEVEEPKEEVTINLLGTTNDEQARQYTTTAQEEKELNEAVAQLTTAISKNPNLTKIQKEFFLELAADPEGTGEGSIASYSTQNSIASLRKATDFIQEDLKDREKLRQKKKNLRAPKKATRETSVHENLWKAHAKRIAPQTVLQHMRGTNDSNKEDASLRSSDSLVLNKFKDMRKQAEDEHLHSSMPTSMPMHSKIRDITIDDIATPKRSNTQKDESTKRLAEGGGADALGLAMPGFSDDEDDDDNDDDDDDIDIDAYDFNDDGDACQIDFPVGFNNDHVDNDDMDMGSITDSLLTDNSNDYDNSLLDSCYENHETPEARPDTTVLFSTDRLPSSLSSIVRRAGEDDEASVENHDKSKKLQPILRNSQYSNDGDSSVGGSSRKRLNSCPSSMPSMFFKPEIREDFGAGFEIIAHGYHFDDASVADTDSLSSYHPWTGVVAHRGGSCSSQYSVPSLHRCDAEDDASYISYMKSVGCNSVPSLHRCDAVEEQSLLSYKKALVGDESNISPRQRAESLPNTYQLDKSNDVSGEAALGDDLTALDDTSVVSYKKVQFSGVSVGTEEKYPETKEDSKQSSDGADSLTVSTDGSEPRNTASDEKLEDHIVNDDDSIGNCSWSIATMETKDMKYDAWDVFKDDYVKETVDLPFEIFGTSATDVSSMPHVLSPPLIDSLRHFVPDRLFHNNLWMKYSLIRDGASMSILLRNIRGSNAVLLAIETTVGDVFGCYTSTPWKKTYGYFGTGECFVWKMKQRRGTKCYSLLNQVQMESEVEVFAFSNENDMIQVCKQDFLAVGGGTISDASALPNVDLTEVVNNVEAGFAIALDEELLNGTSSPCATFLSPCLTDSSSPTGEVFEVVNLEAWTFTPCSTEEQAERNELGKMFREGNTDMDVIGTYIGGNGFGGGGSGRF